MGDSGATSPKSDTSATHRPRVVPNLKMATRDKWRAQVVVGGSKSEKKRWRLREMPPGELKSHTVLQPAFRGLELNAVNS